MPQPRLQLATAWSRLPPLWVWGAFALLVVVGTGLHVGASYQQVRAARLAAELEAAKARATQQASKPVAPPDQSQEFKKKLVSRQRADDVVRDAGRLAQATNMSVSAIAITPVAATPAEWGHVGITLQAVCSYSACKAFIAELLGRYPSLAIISLGLKPTAAGGAMQDLRLGLALYVKD